MNYRVDSSLNFYSELTMEAPFRHWIKYLKTIIAI